MKMTLVVDTDDPKGIDAAWEMVAILQKKAGRTNVHEPTKQSFGKIEYIKQLRKYVREQTSALEDPDNLTTKEVDNMHSLRNVKRFADRIFNGERS
jgi:hypothetical protein